MPRHKMQVTKESLLDEKLKIATICKYFSSSDINASLSAYNKDGGYIRELPRAYLVYYIICMSYFVYSNTKEVLRCMHEGLRSKCNNKPIKITGKSGISQARSRLGYKPLEKLYNDTVLPISKESDNYSYYKSFRCVSIDGTRFNLRDEESNAKEFGYPGSPSGTQSAYPQCQVVALVENGTHILFGAKIAPVKVGEKALAREVLLSLKSDMLCIADRLYYDFESWSLGVDCCGALLWRVKDTLKLPVEKVLSDGSYISTVMPHNGKKAYKQEVAKTVRVIEYNVTVNAGGKKTTKYKLITNLLDSKKYPAKELAELYHSRWEIESVFDEIKSHMYNNQVTLRSKRADLVKQEFYGLLLAHFAIRNLMYEAAESVGESPLKISFTHTINVIRRKIPQVATFSP